MIEIPESVIHELSSNHVAFLMIEFYERMTADGASSAERELFKRLFMGMSVERRRRRETLLALALEDDGEAGEFIG